MPAPPRDAADLHCGTTATGARAGWCYLVGAGPGDPDLLTLRAAELLATADVVLHDELVHPAVVAQATGEARSVGKRGVDARGKQRKQEEIVAELIALARAKKSVVRLKGGDPFLFGRGAEEAAALRAAGIPFEVVPGIASPLGATAYAGIPLTHRDRASSVTFVTAVQRDGADFDWSELAGVRGTLCVFMGIRRAQAICDELVAQARRPRETPAAIVQWISYPRQRTVVGTLADIVDRAARAGIDSPALLIVGDVVGLREAVRWFDAQPLFGKRVLITRPAHQASSTARLLMRRGAEPVSFPTIAIEELPNPSLALRAVDDLAAGKYRLAVFTSDNGARCFFDFVRARGRDARIFGNCLLAAIGPATAAALTRSGLVPDIVAESYVAESLAEAILARVQPGPVLLPRALVARETLPESLQGAGFTVDVVPVYRTVEASRARAGELSALLSSIDVVMLTSSSTVESLCSLLGSDAPRALSNAALASIGPITSKTAERLGLRVAVTASVSTTAGLVDAIESWITGRAG
jgi:uroporphyrinogen III methyltransferase/synthase